MNITILKKISIFAGMREDLVQAGGGNTSVKISDTQMLIKASGCQLSEVTDTAGFARVDFQQIAAFLEEHADVLLSDAQGKKILAQTLLEGSRPSIETFLHSITDLVTMHTHPMLVNVLTARKDGMKILAELFPEALLVGYATPGIQLAQLYYQEYKERLGQRTGFSVIFLKNHGLIVSGKTAKVVMEKTEAVVRRIAEYLGVSYQPYADTTVLYQKLQEWGAIEPGKIVCLSTDRYLHKAVEKYGQTGWSVAFCPDCLVYCGKVMLSVTDEMTQVDADAFVEANGYPVVILYHGNMYLVADTVRKSKEIESVLRFSAQVMLLNKGCAMDFLSQDEQDFLLNWESEKYRRNKK